jgi:orotidine-5'-phosphate decarboxylase
MSNKLIIALDFPSAELALHFIKPLSPTSCKLKVGFELYVSAGPEFVKYLVDQGFDVFLDLKFHDIPHTVASACRAAAKLGVWMMNVHASGGEKMLLAAHDAIHAQVNPPKLIAVTVLTSMDQQQLHSIGLSDTPEMQVQRLAQLSQRCGLDGIVCSAQEAILLRQQLGNDFLLVTPGIRPSGADIGDQHRVMTPEKALLAGVSYMVVGRPITQAVNPQKVIEAINNARLI